MIQIKLTATRGPWQRGEVLHREWREVVQRPVRVSRQSRKLYSFTLSAEQVASLPVIA